VFNDARIVSLCIFAIAFGVRLFHLLASQENPFINVPIVDMSETWQNAGTILKGNVSFENVFWKPPLYAYFVAFIRLFTGSSIFGFFIIQNILGAVNCVLLYFLGRKNFGNAVALVSALVMSLYGPFVFFDSSILSVTLSTFLNLCLFISLEGAATGKGLWRIGVAGIFAGLSAITHQLILIFVVCIPFLLLFRRTGQPDFSMRIKRVAAFVLCTTIAIAPSAVHNLVSGGKLVLISNNSGINFYIGNHEGYNGMDQPPLGIAWSKIQGEAIRALDLDYKNPDTGKVSSFLFAKGIDFAKTKPVEFAGLYAKKLMYLVTGTEVKNNVNPYIYSEKSLPLGLLMWSTPYIAFPFGVLFPFAMIGIIFAIMRKQGKPLLFTFIVSLAFGIALFFVCDRYRMLLVPVLIMFAAYGIRCVVDFIKERNFRSLGVCILWIFFFILSNFANESVFGNNAGQEYYDYYQLGKEYFYKKDFETAESYLEKAVSINENNPDAYLFIGYVMTTFGRLDDALAAADATLSIEPGYQAANLLKAQVYLEKSEPEKAKQELSLIVSNRQYWYDYTPIAADKMLQDIESLVPGKK
jgi:4-amino-4-deoxy-L-arabinose transferase-like glycosyltransferase